MTVAHAHDPRGPLPAILDRLDKVKPMSGGWIARCPAHDDHNPSLKIDEAADGRVLLHCHAGCTVGAICAALGLDEAALFPARENGTRQEVAAYRYDDEDGHHLYDVVRFHPKDFRQRRADGTWGLGDTRRVLYRLPNVRAAIERGDTIYIVEGEKDVLAIERAGACGTCNPMGAGKWRSEYTQQLAGATQVVIVADNDDPGIAHAGHVSQHLEQAHIPHKIALPATGKDAHDHLAAGHSLAELVPRISPAAAAPIVIETWREFADKSTEDVPCIVEGLWPEGALGFIASAPKKGKTWLGLSLALSVASGHDYLSSYRISRQRPVLYVALEGHRASLTHRIACLARGLGINPDQQIDNLHLTYKPRGLNIADPAWAQHLLHATETLGAELVIVDVLRAAALIKENSAEDFAALRANLSPMLDEARSLAFLHHFTKLSETSKERTPAERMSGSGAMYGALDVGVFITGSENGARRIRLEYEARDIATPDACGFELTGKGTGPNGGLTYRDRAWWVASEAPDEDDVDVTSEEIRDWLVENGEATRAQIAAAFDISQKTVIRREIRLLNDLGVTAHQRAGKPTILRPPVPPDPGHHPGQDTLDTGAV